MQVYSNDFIEVLKNSGVHKTVFYENKKSISAAKLLNSACNLAETLMKAGVKKGDRVVVAVKPGIEFLQVIYANMLIRTIVSIIDPEMGRDNYREKLKQFEPNHAFVDSRLILLNEHPILKFVVLKLNQSVPSFPPVKNCQLFTTGLRLPLFCKNHFVPSLIRYDSGSFDLETLSDEDDFLVTYTSGTLNEPKGVVHSYRSLSNSIRYLTEMLHQNGDMAIATHLPHFCLLGINAGIKVYLWNNKMKPKEKINFIRKHGITTLFGPPSDFVPVIDYLSYNQHTMPGCIKNIYIGSAPIYGSFLSKLIKVSGKINIECLYGMTENLMVAIQNGIEKEAETVNGDIVGATFPNVKISIADDHEICVESDQLFSRYWHEQERCIKHYSGDLGRIDEKGRLVLLGRKKDMIIRRNFNVYPGLYEPTINKIDGIKEAVMIGVYNEQNEDEDIILAVEQSSNISADKIMKELSEGKYSIDKEALPDKIIFMKIPHTGRQYKVDKKLISVKLKFLL